MTVVPGGQFTLSHGQDGTVRFLCEGGGGASAASLFIAAGPDTPIVKRDLVLFSPDDLTLTDTGLDCQVDAVFVAVPTAVPVGPRYFELWLTKAGKSKPVKTGVCHVHASLLEFE